MNEILETECKIINSEQQPIKKSSKLSKSSKSSKSSDSSESSESLESFEESFEKVLIENCDKNLINKIILIDGSECDYIPCTLNGNIKLDIMVSKANYGPYLYYRIKCDRPLKKSSLLHPFNKIETDYIKRLESSEIEIGEVVADNEMIRKMFEFLSMSDEELEKHTGHKHTTCYRTSIIKSIIQFWD